MHQSIRFICAGPIVVLATTQLQAVNLFWLGGTGNLLDSNYSDGTTSPLAPTSSDILFLGNGGTVTHSVAGGFGIQRLRVGHNQATPGGQGTATFTINNGAILNLTLGGSNANASLWVGNENNAVLNVDGTGTGIVAAQVAQIGWGNNLNASAVVNITNGGELSVLQGAVNLGNSNIGATPTGVPATLNMSGSSKLTGAGALNVGLLTAAGTYSQTGGTATFGGAITVGDGSSAGSSFSVSSGTVQSTALTIGASTATASATNVSGSISGDAVINVTTGNFNVGLGATQGASLLVAGTADINLLAGPTSPAGNGNLFVGRNTSSNATFTMTGGTIDTGRHVLFGSGVDATNIVGNQSGGTITTTLNFVLSDTGGASTYNLSGTGAIVSNGLVIAGRQSDTGIMNQTGGSVTAAQGVAVGNAQSATTTLWGTGVYNASGGTITANQIAGGTALAIAPQGTGTFRVIGDDAMFDINGDMTVSAAGAGMGTLAYRFETGDLLSLIDVSGNATFSAGAILTLDSSLAAPAQTSYDLLTAVDIIDNGISFSGPAGWSYSIVTGGNGEILRVTQAVGMPGDFNSDTKVDAADYIMWRLNETANAALPNDNGVGNQAARYSLWRANFGNPPGSGTGLSGAEVPEPASMLLYFSAVGALMLTRRR
jgi:hypothetical protein